MLRFPIMESGEKDKEREMHDELKIPATTPAEGYLRLLDIIRLLRRECPWDREQDHKSLRVCLLEEAYEAADAIDREDMDNLREELGDVLLQVVFHSILAEEEKQFTATDIINDECEKMIRRHPHIFENEESNTVDKVLEKWENIKVREHQGTTFEERLRSVPRALPALTKSQKVLSKAKQCGYDWDDGLDLFKRISKLSGELADDKAVLTAEPEGKLGNLLLLCTAAAVLAGIGPEHALEKAADDFVERAIAGDATLR